MLSLIKVGQPLTRLPYLDHREQSGPHPLPNEIAEELPEVMLPDIFLEIQETYWESLKSVPDPRIPGKRIYPLHLILHHIISGFIDGNKYIGVLFPTKRIHVEAGKKKLGSLSTRKAVYKLLRKID